ncbi:TetR/AcrR family transcriptional regulator [Thalassiella azotivora]
MSRGDGPSVPQRLLDAATRLFAERGYEGTSVQQVVDAAGLTKGAMYHYYASKDDLLAQIYTRLLAMQTEHLERIAAADAPAATRLHEAAADVVRTTLANLPDARIYQRSMHQLSADVQKQVRAQRREYHERFRSLVEDGLADGTLRSEVPPDLVVDFFFGSVHHVGQWYRADGPLTAAQVARHFADLLLASLHADPPTDRTTGRPTQEDDA